MTRLGRLRGATLVDTCFLLAVVVLLVVLVLPPLRQTRKMAFAATCKSNLSNLGKSMLLYPNDYGHELPRAGGPGGSWAARTPNWKAGNRMEAYGTAGPDQAGQASVSASLHLLVKYAGASPEMFVCKNDIGTSAWVLADEPNTPPGFGLTDAWDFGSEPTRHVSYAYQMPYTEHRLSFAGQPGSVIAADRNPWMGSPSAPARDFSTFKPDAAGFGGTQKQARAGNSPSHKGDGQNVLFLDCHVEFGKRPYCGIEEDNIYTSWDGADKVRGKPAVFGSQPADPNDSLLVNDPAVPRG
ncbi:MAG: hypothetical protein JW993_09225 [Sedimentisphaerales bacterium]|nr:hypothetical protein [Sedimentisphaerales bacterium]